MSTNKVQHFKHFVNNKTQFQINHAKCRLSQFVFVTFSAAFYSFGHFARRPFKIVYQPAATCDAARVAFICTFVFHLMTMLKCSLPNGLHANRRQTKKNAKIWQEKHFEMQMLRASDSCWDYGVENN